MIENMMEITKMKCVFYGECIAMYLMLFGIFMLIYFAFFSRYPDDE